MIFDYIMKYADEAEALEALTKVKYRTSPIVAVDEKGNKSWGVGLPVRAIIQEAEWDYTDLENPVEVKPEILAPGFFVRVPQDTTNTKLKLAKKNACRVIKQHKKSKINFAASDFKADDLEKDKDGKVENVKIKFSPVFAGSM